MPLSLRDLLENRDTLEDKSTALVKSLLNAQRFMFKKDLCVRNIHPASISVTEQHDQVVFNDMLRVLIQSEWDEFPSLMMAPYAGRHYKENWWFLKKGHFGDRWSIGIIILEILIGSRFLLCLDSFKEIKLAFNCIKDQLDEDTRALLKSYLFIGEETDVDLYVSKVLIDSPDLIGENIRKVSVTIKRDETLSNLKAEADNRWSTRRDSLCKSF